MAKKGTKPAASRNEVRDALEAAIDGVLCGLTVIKALADASNGEGGFDDCAIEWVARKAKEEASAASSLLETLDRMTPGSAGAAA